MSLIREKRRRESTLQKVLHLDVEFLAFVPRFLHEIDRCFGLLLCLNPEFLLVFQENPYLLSRHQNSVNIIDYGIDFLCLETEMAEDLLLYFADKMFAPHRLLLLSHRKQVPDHILLELGIIDELPIGNLGQAYFALGKNNLRNLDLLHGFVLCLAAMTLKWTVYLAWVVMINTWHALLYPPLKISLIL